MRLVQDQFQKFHKRPPLPDPVGLKGRPVEILAPLVHVIADGRAARVSEAVRIALVDLVVQVRAGRVAGGAHIADDLSLANMVPLGHGETGEVGISGLHPEGAVVDADVVAPCADVLGVDDHAVSTGEDGRAHPGLYVEPPMLRVGAPLGRVRRPLEVADTGDRPAARAQRVEDAARVLVAARQVHLIRIAPLEVPREDLHGGLQLVVVDAGHEVVVVGAERPAVRARHGELIPEEVELDRDVRVRCAALIAEGAQVVETVAEPLAEAECAAILVD